jgi:hypothetical protein
MQVVVCNTVSLLLWLNIPHIVHPLVDTQAAIDTHVTLSLAVLSPFGYNARVRMLARVATLIGFLGLATLPLPFPAVMCSGLSPASLPRPALGRTQCCFHPEENSSVASYCLLGRQQVQAP